MRKAGWCCTARASRFVSRPAGTVSVGYQWTWYAEFALAALAALVNLPLRDTHPQPAAATAQALHRAVATVRRIDYDASGDDS